MLDDLFMTILDMSKVASVAILVVLAVRLLLKRGPKVFSYALWRWFCSDCCAPSPLARRL